jgi:hypothetical protein
LGDGDRSVSIRQYGRGDLLSNALQTSRINFAAFCQYLFNPSSAKGLGLALPLRWKSCACAAGVFELPNEAANARACGETHPRAEFETDRKSQTGVRE